MEESKREMERIRQVHIGNVIGVRHNGRRITIRCPFHNERSASLVIYPTGDYYCYGCTAHGANAVDFLMAMGASFIEAKEELKKYI